MRLSTYIVARFWMTLGVLAAVMVISSMAMGDEKMARAKAAHQQGVEFFMAGKYEEASLAFREAKKMRPTWKLDYNIGQCEAASKRYGMALEAFESYLVEGGDEVPDDRREYVSAEIRRIQPLVGVLEVEAPDGVNVVIDGVVRVVMPPDGPLRVAAGRHLIILKDGDHELLSKSVNVAGGMATKVEYSALAGAPTADETAPATDEPQPAVAEEGDGDISPLKTVGWIGVGLGAAVAIGGVITGGMAMGKNNDLANKCPDRENCSDEYEDYPEQADSLALVTDILIPTGAVLLATGVVLLIVGAKRGSSDEEDERADISLAPLAGPGNAGFAIRGRF
jgi:hypothetical protein